MELASNGMQSTGSTTELWHFQHYDPELNGYTASQSLSKKIKCQHPHHALAAPLLSSCLKQFHVM